MIETDRLILRRWRREDVIPLHSMGQGREVMRHIGPATTFAESAFLMKRQNEHADRHGRCFWALERRRDRAFIGFCGIKAGPDGSPIHGLLEISWRLTRAAWHKGFAREAAEACLAEEWRRGTPEIVAITTPSNRRSWGLMLRLGMTRDGEGDFNHPALAEDDPLRGHVTYRISRPA